jgi:hypothetical protein
VIRHVLLVKPKTESTSEQIETARSAFVNIQQNIPGIISVEWGFNTSPEGKHQGYDLCIIMTFENEAYRDAYLPHPKHEALKQDFAPIIDDIIVVDFNV